MDCLILVAPSSLALPVALVFPGCTLSILLFHSGCPSLWCQSCCSCLEFHKFPQILNISDSSFKTLSVFSSWKSKGEGKVSYFSLGIFLRSKKKHVCHSVGKWVLFILQHNKGMEKLFLMKSSGYSSSQQFSNLRSCTCIMSELVFPNTNIHFPPSTNYPGFHVIFVALVKVYHYSPELNYPWFIWREIASISFQADWKIKIIIYSYNSSICGGLRVTCGCF